MVDKYINLMIQFKPDVPYLTEMEICDKYGLKSSTGNNHTYFAMHWMLKYLQDNNKPTVINNDWETISSRTDFYFNPDDVEAAMKLLYETNEYKQKGRIELPAVYSGKINRWADGNPHSHCSAKVYVFRLVDTGVNIWGRWDTRPTQDKKKRKVTA